MSYELSDAREVLADCAGQFADSALHKLAQLAKAFTIGRRLRSVAATAALRGDDPHHVAYAAVPDPLHGAFLPESQKQKDALHRRPELR